MSTLAAVAELSAAPAVSLRAVAHADGVAELYRSAEPSVKAKLLECLLRPLGALALVAVAGGVFGALRSRHGWQRLQVLEDDTLEISAEQVRELACYLQQSAPEVFASLAEMLRRQTGPRLMH
ncbi:MAG: hypothetical protein KA375_06590 [Vitreoscilla sp.]|nr:hypothetical protein [Burkholderiales bacterium]MBP6337244.1 hypothetical protein [Vitreoscilla sp.]